MYGLYGYSLSKVTCQSNVQKQLAFTTQKQAFDYATIEDDYAEILGAIITYDSSFNEVAKTIKPMAYIHQWLIKDSLYNPYEKDFMPNGQRIHLDTA